MRYHWAKRAKYNKSWHYEILLSKNKAKIVGQPKHAPVAIRIDRNYHGRAKPLDRDNLVGAMKPVIDALITNGIIKDDDPESVRELVVNQNKVNRSACGLAIRIQLLQ